MAVWTIEEVRNAKSLNAENTHFDVEINHPELGWIPYTLSPDDPDGSISNEELLSAIGSSFAQFVPPTSEESIQTKAAQIRAERTSALERWVDPLVMNTFRWNDLTETQRTEWTNYRRAWLDITDQSGFPHEVTYPTLPEPRVP
tara:strand:- start:66 stop:497 length:432 start_codon:yes stop_codon:yes gene_type:complete